MKKEELISTVEEYSKLVGGVDNFIELLTTVKSNRENILLSKEASYKDKDLEIQWKKSIYKETLTSLFTAIKKEDKESDMLNNLAPKEYKSTMTMMKILKPISISISTNKGEDFSFNILDTSEAKKTKITPIFKIIFFYNLGMIKQTLDIEISND